LRKLILFLEGVEATEKVGEPPVRRDLDDRTPDMKEVATGRVSLATRSIPKILALLAEDPSGLGQHQAYALLPKIHFVIRFSNFPSVCNQTHTSKPSLSAADLTETE